jgi:hypothetical protein
MGENDRVKPKTSSTMHATQEAFSSVLARLRLTHAYPRLGSCSFYRGKVKSTPSFGLGWEFDNNSHQSTELQGHFLSCNNNLNLKKHGFDIIEVNLVIVIVLVISLL